MTTRLAGDLLGRLRGALCPRNGGEAPDAQLLTRYLARREEAAFEAIVRRHGPMVLGVCRRVLRRFIAQHEEAAFAVLIRRYGRTVFCVCRCLLPCEADAEDAFQATFLVLVRKAQTVVPRERLGGWLHGVAQRTAWKARTTRARWEARGRLAMSANSATPAEA